MAVKIKSMENGSEQSNWVPWGGETVNHGRKYEEKGEP